MWNGIFEVIVAGVHYDYGEGIIFEIILQGAHHESHEMVSWDKICRGERIMFYYKRGIWITLYYGKVIQT